MKQVQDNVGKDSILWQWLNIRLLPFEQFRIQSIILFVVVCILYANTIPNEYAIDDTMVITENNFTRKGLAGIPKILTTDSFMGFKWIEQNLLAGGRYRPLSIVTFAIEYQFFGLNPHVSHAINLLLYALSCISLLALLRKYFFPYASDFCFIVALLFTIHPIHTEAVANIKGRDEILSLLFLIIATHFSFKWITEADKKIINLGISLFCFFLALLSKENGLAFLAILPLSWYVFGRVSLAKAATYILPFILVVGVYFAIRIGFTGPIRVQGGSIDVLNDPYGAVTKQERLATISYVFLRYWGLLVFPHPMSWDYSFPQIPYYKFSDPIALLAFVLNIGLVIWASINVWKRNLFAYAILFYYLSMFLASNIIINIGAFMGDRLLYQGSIGFSLLVGAGLLYIIDKAQNLQVEAKRGIVLGFLGLVGIAATAKTVQRNFDWKNSETLSIADVKACPESVKTNQSAAGALKKLGAQEKDKAKKDAYFQQALQHLKKSTTLHPNYAEAYLEIGNVYYEMREIDSVEKYWKIGFGIYPDHPFKPEYYGHLCNLYGDKSKTEYMKGNVQLSLDYLNTALAYNPKNDFMWFNLGATYRELKDYPNAIRCAQKSVELNPDRGEYWNSLGVALANSGRVQEAIPAFERAILRNPKDTESAQALQTIKNALAAVGVNPNNPTK